MTRRRAIQLQDQMTNVYYQQPDGEEITVDLRDPRLAAFLAWLWPGAGHFYQRRFLKGFLFMICIMGTFIYGMLLGQGRVVYASFRQNDFRWQYICQAGIGSPAILAFVQKLKTDGGNDPLFVLCERYPRGSEFNGREFEIVDPSDNYDGPTIKDGFMAPPVIVEDPDENDVLGMWHAAMRQRYDVGTIFTVLAGLLNILAIYDAFAGPLFSVDPKHKKRREKSRLESTDDNEQPGNEPADDDSNSIDSRREALQKQNARRKKKRQK